MRFVRGNYLKRQTNVASEVTMHNRQLFSLLFSGIAYLFLTGFFFGTPERDAMYFIRDTQSYVKASHKLHLPPKPEIKKTQPVVYEAGELDPFSLQSFVLETGPGEDEYNNMKCMTADCGDGAPTPHDPYFLEDYDLDKLQMVGTMADKKGKRIALVQTPDLDVVRTKEGEYIGRNNGLILSVDPDHIVIQEKQRVPQGWQNRTNTLELFN